MKKTISSVKWIFCSGHSYVEYMNNAFLISVFLDAHLLNERAGLDGCFKGQEIAWTAQRKHLELQLCKTWSLIQPYILFFLCQNIWKLNRREDHIICISVACLWYKSYLHISLFLSPYKKSSRGKAFLEGLVSEWGVICHLPSAHSLHINKKKLIN